MFLVKIFFLDLTVFMDVHGNLGLLGELETVSAVYGLEEGRLSHLSQDGMTRLSFTHDKVIFLRSNENEHSNSYNPRISPTCSCKQSHPNLRLFKRVSNAKQHHIPTILSTFSPRECMLQQVATLNVNAWVTILFNLDFQWAFTVY